MEIWVPYGDVEALLTLQAENLGEVIEGKADDHTQELAEKLETPFRESTRMMLCDSRSPTLKILQALRALRNHLMVHGTFRAFPT